MPSIRIAFLEDKDLAIMKALSTIRTVEEKVEPLLAIREVLRDMVQALVFKNEEKDAKYEIKLDENHSIIFELKGGAFSFDQTCNCDEEDHEPESVELKSH